MNKLILKYTNINRNMSNMIYNYYNLKKKPFINELLENTKNILYILDKHNYSYINDYHVNSSNYFGKINWILMPKYRLYSSIMYTPRLSIITGMDYTILYPSIILNHSLNMNTIKDYTGSSYIYSRNCNKRDLNKNRKKKYFDIKKDKSLVKYKKLYYGKNKIIKRK